MIHTYNEYHLGDNLIHLHYLRKACEQNVDLAFTHHCNVAHHDQLTPLLEDMPIELADLMIPPHSINAWIGDKNFYYNSPNRGDWVKLHLDWFDNLSNTIEIPSPMACKEDFLFDYPALKNRGWSAFDYLIINSPPMSNQLPSYTPEFFHARVKDLCNKGFKVITTHPTGMTNCTLDWGLSVTGIGQLSQVCHRIEGIDTGPLWTTHNVWNQDTVIRRVIYTNEAKPYLSKNTVVLDKV